MHEHIITIVTVLKSSSLAFLSVLSRSRTVPSASTASTPNTDPWRDPYLRSLSPPDGTHGEDTEKAGQREVMLLLNV